MLYFLLLADACIRCFGTRRVTGEMMRGSSAFAIFAAVAQANAEPANPSGKVLDLIDELTAEVTADGEKADKAYKEYFEWCDDTSQNLGFEIKTAKVAKEKLESSISKLTSDIEVAISKI